MPIFVWWAVVLVVIGFSAQVFLDDKTVGKMRSSKLFGADLPIE